MALFTCCIGSLFLFLAKLHWHPSSTDLNLRKQRFLTQNRRLDAEYGKLSAYSEDEGEFGYDDIVEDPVDEDEDDDYTNPEFHEEDFSPLHWKVPKSSFRVKFNATSGLDSVDGLGIVRDGIFWSDEVEKASPSGIPDDQVEDIMTKLRTQTVMRMQSPSWLRCGRPKNQFVTLVDGSKACARYRSPHDYLIQGEVMSFYLARLLGILNVPIVVLSQVRKSTFFFFLQICDLEIS